MRELPFELRHVRALVEEGYPTPFYIYDAWAIQENARKLFEAFDWMPAFTNYFAVKALPNPHMLSILKDEGMGVDCSSLGELALADRVGLSGEDIILTSNNTPEEEFQRAHKLGAIINFDADDHLEFYGDVVGSLPEVVSFRYNPGHLKVGNEKIGDPVEAKFGMTRDQVLYAYARSQNLGVKRFGLHTMVCSDELDYTYFLETVEILFELATELHERLGINFEFINIGGGLGIPYKPDEEPFDLDGLSQGMKSLYDESFGGSILHRPRIAMECGRYITGPYGYLVTSVRHLKETYKSYVCMDACMANLPRPGMYGAYHHITNMSNPQGSLIKVDVVGSLCENNDKFAINREIPESSRGDIFVMWDTGAHCHAMGSNYNAKPRCPEFLMSKNMSMKMIRRAETLKDLFTTFVD